MGSLDLTQNQNGISSHFRSQNSSRKLLNRAPVRQVAASHRHDGRGGGGGEDEEEQGGDSTALPIFGHIFWFHFWPPMDLIGTLMYWVIHLVVDWVGLI